MVALQGFVVETTYSEFDDVNGLAQAFEGGEPWRPSRNERETSMLSD